MDRLVASSETERNGGAAKRTFQVQGGRGAQLTWDALIPFLSQEETLESRWAAGTAQHRLPMARAVAHIPAGNGARKGARGIA